MSIRSRLKFRTRLRSIIHRLWPPEPKPLILMYHRIAEKPIDYWNLAVSPAHFAEHLHIIAKTRQPFALKDFSSKLVAGTLPLNAIAVTFDDGYLDNLTSAKPLLEQAGVPATVFIATGYTGAERFWWDELEKLFFFGNRTQGFEFWVQNHPIRIDFGDESPARQDGTTPHRLLRKRSASLLETWEVLRRLERDQRDLAMGKLRSIVGKLNYFADFGRPMNRDEVRTLVAGGLVTIGAHTVSHPVLDELPPTTCRREITNSKVACEHLSSISVDLFAYPFGRFNAKVCEAVKAAGFSSACSTQHGPSNAASDVFALPRIHVPNRDGASFERLLHSASTVR